LQEENPLQKNVEKSWIKIFTVFKFFVYLLYNLKQNKMILNPIDPSELRARLNRGTVQFAFKKLDGNLRTAIGTTCIENIPVDHHPKGGTSSDKVVVYFDLQKSEWRSVNITREIFISE
jgi:hypothetical protein